MTLSYRAERNKHGRDRQKFRGAQNVSIVGIGAAKIVQQAVQAPNQASRAKQTIGFKVHITWGE